MPMDVSWCCCFFSSPFSLLLLSPLLLPFLLSLWWYSWRDSLIYDALLLLFSKVCLSLWLLNIQLLQVLIYTSLIIPSWNLWALWIWMYIYLPRLRNFSAIISLNKLSTFFSLSSLWNSHNVCIDFPVVSHSFFSLFFLFLLWLYNFKCSVFDFAGCFFCLIKSAVQPL